MNDDLEAAAFGDERAFERLVAPFRRTMSWSVIALAGARCHRRQSLIENRAGAANSERAASDG